MRGGRTCARGTCIYRVPASVPCQRVRKEEDEPAGRDESDSSLDERCEIPVVLDDIQVAHLLQAPDDPIVDPHEAGVHLAPRLPHFRLEHFWIPLACLQHVSCFGRAGLGFSSRELGQRGGDEEEVSLRADCEEVVEDVRVRLLQRHGGRCEPRRRRACRCDLCNVSARWTTGEVRGGTDLVVFDELTRDSLAVRQCSQDAIERPHPPRS